MEIERRLEIQRLRLLRLLAGLALLVGLVSRAPAVSMLPAWVHAHVASVLARAERAAENLVIVAACLLSQARVGVAPCAVCSDDAPLAVSGARLLRRIAALQSVLNDLPRHAERLLKRLAKARRKDGTRESAAVWPVETVAVQHHPVDFDERVERPPDKRVALSSR